MFTTPFEALCEKPTIHCMVEGFEVIATLHRDDDASPPWKRDDGHGPVSDWTHRPKTPGERVLCKDGKSHRYYDFAAAVEKAKAEGWGAPDRHFRPDATPTPGEIAHAAAEFDLKVLQAWCSDEWWYVGVAVTIQKAGVKLTGPYDHALWGIEYNYPDSDNASLLEVANELLPEAIAAAKAKVAELVKPEETTS